MSLQQALGVSVSGMATVFLALVFLALAIIVVGLILSALGLGSNMQAKKDTKATKTASTMPASANANSGVLQAQAQEDMEEYAVILAAVSEHTRIPIERLKIKSITKR